ncbi:hypothetical protein Dda_4586 [Drechslerella dactyloides]|uniref:Uncharacterized protein n=1 Tax=Drechslerella dactyloides TaxID=74499 RepID=A0AAD6IX81_DREDA|nr:hypothetical protein Dda_4586 [Drechslerella dactyloides]
MRGAEPTPVKQHDVRARCKPQPKIPPRSRTQRDGDGEKSQGSRRARTTSGIAPWTNPVECPEVVPAAIGCASTAAGGAEAAI